MTQTDLKAAFLKAAEGHGVAIHDESGPDIDGEPFMSMEKAAEIHAALNHRPSPPDVVEALKEVERVLLQGQPAIACTVWTTGDNSETLLDHVQAALASAKQESVDRTGLAAELVKHVSEGYLVIPSGQRNRDLAGMVLHTLSPSEAQTEPKVDGVEGMTVLLPPASDVPQQYLEGWCEGQAYLIENYGKEGDGDKAIQTADAILTALDSDTKLRNDTLEEAAKVAEGFPAPADTDTILMSKIRHAQRIAQSIRALKTKDTE